VTPTMLSPQATHPHTCVLLYHVVLVLDVWAAIQKPPAALWVADDCHASGVLLRLQALPDPATGAAAATQLRYTGILGYTEQQQLHVWHVCPLVADLSGARDKLSLTTGQGAAALQHSCSRCSIQKRHVRGALRRSGACARRTQGRLQEPHMLACTGSTYIFNTPATGTSLLHAVVGRRRKGDGCHGRGAF
jgi:hypothetical protein